MFLLKGRTYLLGLPGVVGLALIACATSTTREGFDQPTPATTSSTSSSGATTSGGFGGDAAPPSNTDGCSEDAKLVYVLSFEGDLYSFAPAAKKFTKIGPLNCKSGTTKFIPISMAVDRTAVAWVNMRDKDNPRDPDVMFKVDTKTAACTPTAIKGGMGGMGFSTNEGTTDKETLFVIGPGSSASVAGLIKVDFAKEQLVPVVDLTAEADLELTGTGDGRLYGFIQSEPLALAKINKTTGALSDNVSLAKVDTPLPPLYAFSFWGGDFYFYTATCPQLICPDPMSAKTSNVTRYRPSDGSIDTAYMTNIGFRIVGAGVSTCAPVSVPK